MADVTQKLLRLAAAGATVLIAHHGPKSEVFKDRGSSEILAAVDVALAMSADKTKAGAPITMECLKHRLSEEFKITLELDMGQGCLKVVADPLAQKANERIEKLKDIIRTEPRLRQKDIIAKAKVPEKQPVKY